MKDQESHIVPADSVNLPAITCSTGPLDVGSEERGFL